MVCHWKKFIYAFIKSEILTPRNLKFKAVNIYDELMKNYFMNRKKEELKSDKINIKHKKQEKEKYKIPRSVQDTIPIKTIWKDGIFLVEQNRYALTFKITDINYAVASREDKESMFLVYSELLNSFDSGTTTKITIALRRINQKNFEKEILLDYKNDELDKYRYEYNQILLDKAIGSNGMVREIYITLSVFKKRL